MIGLLCFVLVVLASPFKSKLRLEAENAVLRRVRRCMAIDILMQAIASSLLPRLAGSPKNPMIASPTYLSIVAPWLTAILDISVRY
jgi:hypothetical protein